MEDLIANHAFLNFSLENYYFTNQSIVVAVVTYLRSLKKKCDFLGVDFNDTPILVVNNFNYKLIYRTDFLGLVKLDNMRLKKINENDNIVINHNAEFSKTVFDNINGYYE